MKKIIELKIEETKAVVGGVRVVVAPPWSSVPRSPQRSPAEAVGARSIPLNRFYCPRRWVSVELLKETMSCKRSSS
jgi:hypothetical protein